MHIALVTKAFAFSNNDYCLPPLIDFVRSLSDRVSVDIYALDYPAQRRSYALFGARVFAVGSGHLPRLSRAVARRNLTRALVRQHAHRPYDLIHAVWADHPADLAAGLAARLNLPLVTSLYAGEATWLPQIGYGSLGRAGRKAALASVLARSAAVTAGSATLSQQVAQDFGVDVLSLPLGYDPARFTEAGPRHDFGPGRHIVTAASFGPVKGLSLVMAALERVARQSPRLLEGVTWHVIGPDPGDRALREALGARIGALPVRLHEARPHWEMPEVYRAADLALIGSWHESQCFAAIEAVACGAAVMGSSVGILPQMVSPDWRCPVADEAAMADLIARKLGAPETWQPEVARQQAWLGQHATLAIARDRFLGLYRSVLQDARATDTGQGAPW